MDVFDLYAKIRLDTEDYEKGLSGAKSKFSDFASGLKNAAGAVVDVLAGIGKTAVAGIGAASAALTAITKQSLDQVSQYEQMVGGVEKIFEGSAQKVIDFSHEAFETAGMSANEYMETITSFSASLIHSLAGDTEKAADLANQAIIDMSDNANVFGTDMQSVQYAYMGFAKQNYTMLDNLKLGYGGTAKEMARLLNESGVLGNNLINLDDTKGLNDAINEAGFAKIIEAIHVTQERLNITNTTANEAAKTLEGSARAMKAAWANFLTGVGTPEQFSRQIETSLKNIRANLNNIIPRITTGLIELADLLAPELPKIVEELLPSIITSSSSLITGLAERLPQLLTAILPSLATGVVDVATALVSTMPQLIKPLGQAVEVIGNELVKNKDKLLTAGGELLDMVITPLTQNSKEIGETAVVFVSNLASKIADANALEKIGSVAGDIISGLANGLTSQESISAFMDAAPKFLSGFANGIKNFLVGENNEGGLLGAVESIINNIGEWFENDKNRDKFEADAIKFLDAMCKGITSILSKSKDIILAAAKTFLDVFLGDINYDEGADKFLESINDAIARKADQWGWTKSGRDKVRKEGAFAHVGTGSIGEFEKEWNDIQQGFIDAGMTDEAASIETYNYFMAQPPRDFMDTEAGQRLKDKVAQWTQADEEKAFERLAELERSDVFRNSPLLQKKYMAYNAKNPDASFEDTVSVLESMIRERNQEIEKSKYVSNYGIPAYGDGVIVSKPTLAWIGERGEKEAVVPLEHETDVSRALGLGGINITFGDIYVQGGEDAGRQFMQKVDEELRFWQIQQKRGVGGAAWQN